MNYYNQEEIPDQKYFLNERSETMLKEVQPGLAEVVRRAVAISDLEIQVIHGKRTLDQQDEFFRKGATRGTQSVHLYGYAVDLMPIVEGRPCMEAEVYDEVAMCMKLAAEDLNTPIRWGGAWHYDNLCLWQGMMEDLQMDYIDGMRRQGKRPSLDLCHFELSIS